MTGVNYLALALGALCVAAASAEVTVVREPGAPTAAQGRNYVLAREPLVPSRFVKLPIGSIEPRGWLRNMLIAESKGMVGRLAEISPWLKFEGNAWADPHGDHSGWEELPYWLKGYGDLGYVLKDEAIIKAARRWIDAVLASGQPDGWFGPIGLKTSLDGHADLWPHMVMLNILQSFYEATGDPRVVPFMTNYFRWQAAQPAGPGFVAGYWPKMRVGDNIESVLWVYNRTGEPWLLDLARKLHEHSARWDEGLINWHGVNITQGFREPTMIWPLSGRYVDLASSERNYDEIMKLYGQTVGGGFGADENARPGYTDPRQGFETCSIVEGMHSYEMLHRLTGSPVWADRTEELAFNTLPAALTPEQTGLRYLTAANMPQADHLNHSPGIQNGGTMISYSPWECYRCCQHNVSHGWPYFAEECWLASADGGLCAALYTASEVTAKVADGQTVTIAEETDYPFGETVNFRVEAPQPTSFPLYLRVPGWATEAELTVNGEPVDVSPEPLRYIRIDREWRSGDTVGLVLPMHLRVRQWPSQKNAVSVERGPLAYSLLIGERWQRYGGTDEWPEEEVLPSTAWNYGLDFSAGDPAANLVVSNANGPLATNPFTPSTVPVRIRAKARRIPQWGFDDTGLVAVLQPSPARSTEPVETVTLIPMGAARIRIAMFPTVSADGTKWLESPRSPITASHCGSGDTLLAVNDGIEPRSSDDRDLPRMTWWSHLGTAEWLAYDFREAKTVSKAEVYWYDDETTGGYCRVPQSWTLLYRDGKAWKPVSGASDYGVAKDGYNTVTFEPVSTQGLRLEVQLQPNYSAGVLEWKVQ